MLIIGAGMAGLLAANLLHRFNPTVLEKAPSLPNNHAALLRFRSDEIPRATQWKIPCDIPMFVGPMEDLPKN